MRIEVASKGKDTARHDDIMMKYEDSWCRIALIADLRNLFRPSRQCKFFPQKGTPGRHGNCKTWKRLRVEGIEKRTESAINLLQLFFPAKRRREAVRPSSPQLHEAPTS